MPGKHVRFATTDTVHPQRPPPLTNSSFSPASTSSMPLTPPSYPGVLPGPSPYVLPFPQAPTVKSARIHALLKDSNAPLINFDLRNHPSAITSHHKGIRQRVFDEPATSPPLPSIIIVIPDLPWRLTVYPSNGRAFVTVNDVLQELYHSLRTNIAAQEFHSLPSKKEQRAVTHAYEQRYRRFNSSREYDDEKRRGVRRVDFLMGRTRFLGLASTPSGPDVWVLHST